MIEKLKFIYRAFKYRFSHDKTEINYLLTHINSGATVIDIGCHKGAYLYWMQKKVTTTGQVFAFEPQPILANYLKNCIGLFGYKNITIENMGLSNTNGTLDLFIPVGSKKTSPGATFNTDKPVNEKCDSVSIAVTTLDNYCGAKNIQPQFLKIDVEGYELEVLTGAENTLRKHKPNILFECEARHTSEDKMMATFNYLKQIGYKGYFISKNEVLPIEEFNAKKHQVSIGENFWDSPDYCNNFIFEG